MRHKFRDMIPVLCKVNFGEVTEKWIVMKRGENPTLFINDNQDVLKKTLNLEFENVLEINSSQFQTIREKFKSQSGVIDINFAAN